MQPETANDPDILVPHNQSAAEAMIAKIGRICRDLEIIDAAYQERLAEITAERDAQTTPLSLERDRLIEGLRRWATANREALTDGGKRKRVALLSGVISWRKRPPSVELAAKPADIISRIKMRGLAERFIRIAENIDRQAMLKEPDLAATIDGVNIVAEREDFIVEPGALK